MANRTAPRKAAPRKATPKKSAPAPLPDWFVEADGRIREVIERQKKDAPALVRLGQDVAEMKRRKGHKLAGLPRETFYQRRYGFGDSYAGDLARVGERVDTGEVQGKLFDVSSLIVISRTEEPYRGLLLDHGSGQTAEVLKAAREVALACRSEEEGEQKLLAVLQQPDQAAALLKEARKNRKVHKDQPPQPQTPAAAAKEADQLMDRLLAILTAGALSERKGLLELTEEEWEALQWKAPLLVAALQKLLQLKGHRSVPRQDPEDDGGDDGGSGGGGGPGSGGGPSKGEGPGKGRGPSRQDGEEDRQCGARDDADQGPLAPVDRAQADDEDDQDEHDQDEHDQDDQDQEEESLASSPVAAPTGSPSAPAPSSPPPAPRPYRRSPWQVDLPVSYPADTFDVTPAERLVACIIVALHDSVTTTRSLLDHWEQDRPVAAWDLQYLVVQGARSLRSLIEGLQPRLQPGADRGLALLNAALDQDPALTLDQVLPLPVGDASYPMTWATFQARDPFNELEPTSAEPFFWRLIGLYDYIQKTLAACRSLLDRGDLLAHDLQYQLVSALEQGAKHALFIVATFTDGALRAAPEMAAGQTSVDQILAQQRKNLIVLGQNGPCSQYVVIGKTGDKPLAITLDTPQFIFAQGQQGSGKTHLGLLLLEAAEAPQPGLSEITTPLRGIRFAADWNQGVSGDEIFGGFFENPDPYDWARLRRDHGAVPGDITFRDGTLLCLQDSVARLREKFAPLVERGLRIRALKLHPTEMGAFGYGVFLSGKAPSAGDERPQYRALLESIIAWHGEDADPGLISRELSKHKLGQRVLGPMLAQLQVLKGLVSPNHYVIDVLKRKGPVIVYLEGRFLGKDQVLPLEVAILNALSRPLRNGEDPPRLIMMDELSKRLVNGVTGEFFKEAGQEIRHRPIWLYLSAQRVSDLPSGLPPLIQIYVQFNTPSPEELRKAKAHFGVLSRTRYRTVQRLNRGEALVGAQEATDRGLTRRARKASLRPCALWTAGESYRAT